MAAEANAVQADADTAFPSSRWKRLRRQRAGVVRNARAGAVERYANQIGKVTWPAEAQDEATALIADNAKWAGIYYACAKAPTGQGAIDIVNATPNSGEAASAMRVALGLPIER